MLIAGSTSSGKTHLVKDILLNREKLIEKPVERVIYYYKTWQPLYEELRARIQQITFRNELNVTEEPEKAPENSCFVVIFDGVSDAMTHSSTGLFILSHWTIYSHHSQYLSIFISQNLYDRNKYQRPLSLNSNYLILFRNLRDIEQVGKLARQVYGKGRAKHFMKLYMKIMTSGPRYSYLILNLHPHTLICQSVHVNITGSDSFEPEKLERVYIPKPMANYI